MFQGLWKKYFKKSCSQSCDHGVSFLTREKAEILVSHVNRDSRYRVYQVEQCECCKKFYSSGEWTSSAKKLRKEIGIKS